MFDEPKEKPRAKRRALQEEEFNRDGHWVRSFTVRQEVWPIIEHWASENRFRLVALKGKKRGYEKSIGANLYKIILEMKQVENEFTITAWIKVGFAARAFYLFFHPRELPIDASGWKGSVVRRNTCHEINQLLERLRQPAIAGSLNFHISDLDHTTRWLVPTLALPISIFLVGTLKQLDPNAPFAADVLKLAWKPLAILTALSLISLVVHNFVIVKKYSKPLFKNISMVGFFLVVTVACVFLFSSAYSSVDRNRFITYCFKNPNPTQCDALKKRLSEKDREWILERMNELEKELSVRPK